MPRAQAAAGTSNLRALKAPNPSGARPSAIQSGRRAAWTAASVTPLCMVATKAPGMAFRLVVDRAAVRRNDPQRRPAPHKPQPFEPRTGRGWPAAPARAPPPASCRYRSRRSPAWRRSGPSPPRSGGDCPSAWAGTARPARSPAPARARAPSAHAGRPAPPAAECRCLPPAAASEPRRRRHRSRPGTPRPIDRTLAPDRRRPPLVREAGMQRAQQVKRPAMAVQFRERCAHHLLPEADARRHPLQFGALDHAGVVAAALRRHRIVEPALRLPFRIAQAQDSRRPAAHGGCRCP